MLRVYRLRETTGRLCACSLVRLIRFINLTSPSAHIPNFFFPLTNHHSVAGVSRSPTIAIAYLMREHHLTAEQALHFVREKHPILAPNAGFLKQLQVFEKMNCHVDANHEEYRTFLAKAKHTISFVDEIRHLMNQPDNTQAFSANDPIEIVEGSVCSLFDESDAR